MIRRAVSAVRAASPFDGWDLVGLIALLVLGYGLWLVWPPLAYIVPASLVLLLVAAVAFKSPPPSVDV